MPLSGRRVLVTRARDQASELVSCIQERGGIAHLFSVITTIKSRRKHDVAALRDAAQKLHAFDWIFFTSANAVRFFLQSIHPQSIANHPGVVAVGPATAQALSQHGVLAYRPEQFYSGQGLFAFCANQLKLGQNILLPRGGLADAWLPTKLEEMGMNVTPVIVYDTVCAYQKKQHIYYVIDLLEKKKMYGVAFTSPSTITFFVQLLRGVGVSDITTLLQNSKIACMGPTTARTARQFQLHHIVLAKEATVTSLIETLC